MCALTASRHLIHPLGFEITDKNLRRAGMDYWHSLDVHHHADWAAFRRAVLSGPRRLWLPDHPSHPAVLEEVDYAADDRLVFGNEGTGPRNGCTRGHRGRAALTSPFRSATRRCRSLNLSTAQASRPTRQCGSFGRTKSPPCEDRTPPVPKRFQLGHRGRPRWRGDNADEGAAGGRIDGEGGSPGNTPVPTVGAPDQDCIRI